MNRTFLPRALLLPLVLSSSLLGGCSGGGGEPGAGEGAQASDGAAALHEAARAGRIDEVRRLVEDVGVPVDAGDRYDATALMMAADRGHAEIVTWLLGAGAEVNHREVFFDTSAFDAAVWRERIDVARLLLAAGADQREDAVEIAIEQNLPELARAAVEAGPLDESALAALRSREDLSPELRELLRGAASRPDPPPPVYTPEQLARFAGEFESWDASDGPETRLSVSATDAGLRLVVDGGEPVEVEASGRREFASRDGRLGVSFWGRLGTVESATLRREGAPPRTLRQSVAREQGPAAYVYDAAAEPPPAAAAAEGNWPQFRGPRAEGVGVAKGLPATWDVDGGTGVRWKVAVPGLGNSSPIVWGDRVFVTTAVAEGIAQNVRTGLTGAVDPVDESVPHHWRVLAFDRRSGEELWDTEIGSGVPLTRRHFKASQANATPATDGRRIVVVFPTAGVACLDMDGRVLWRHDLGGLNVSSPNDPGVEWGFASSPVIWDGRVIAQIDTYHDPHLVAWDLETGERLWRVARDVPPSWATPTVVEGQGGPELVVNGATIHGYDPATGEELWSLGPNSELVIATPVAGDGLVYLSAGYAPVKPIYALRLGTRGALEVDPGASHEALAWSHRVGGAYMPTPLLYRGILYVVHHNGRIVAYDAGSGAAIYKSRFSRGGTFTASPVAADGRLYASTEEGLVYVLEAGPEYREVAVNEMGAPLMASPAIAPDALYLRTTRELVAVGG